MDEFEPGSTDDNGKRFEAVFPHGMSKSYQLLTLNFFFVDTDISNCTNLWRNILTQTCQTIGEGDPRVVRLKVAKTNQT